jgi:hypothetical protein
LTSKSLDPYLAPLQARSLRQHIEHRKWFHTTFLSKDVVIVVPIFEMVKSSSRGGFSLNTYALL